MGFETRGSLFYIFIKDPYYKISIAAWVIFQLLNQTNPIFPHMVQMIEVPIGTLEKQRFHMTQILDISKSYQLLIFFKKNIPLKKTVTNPQIPDS